MNIKNYTSSVAANTTVSFIETYLADCGVTGISKEFAKGQPVALTFRLSEEGKTFCVWLPANVEEVHEFLWRDYVSTARRPRNTKEDFREQATRTAWKIQQDWVQVQMSLVRLKQAKALQVFMAFLWDGQQTFYEQLRGNKFKALPEATG